MMRAAERVHTGSSQLRTELLQQAGQGQNRSLYVLMQVVELRRELVCERDSPIHDEHNMSLKTYPVKNTRPLRNPLTRPAALAYKPGVMFDLGGILLLGLTGARRA